MGETGQVNCTVRAQENSSERQKVMHTLLRYYSMQQYDILIWKGCDERDVSVGSPRASDSRQCKRTPLSSNYGGVSRFFLFAQVAAGAKNG